MSHSFKQYKQFETAAPAAKAPEKKAPDPIAVGSQKFSSKTAASVSETINKKKFSAFVVHPLVAAHMGLEKREEADREHEIQREMDRRWLEAKEKAEVEGYTTGLNTGKREAYNAEKPRIEDKLRRFDLLLQQIDTMREKIFVANEDFVMKLMAQLMRVIVLKEVELDKDYLKRLVLHLIQQLGEKSDISLTIGELDVALIKNLRESIEHKFGEMKNLKILTNSEVAAGSCRLETNSVVIDASIENQIRNAMQVFTDQKQSENKQN